MDQKKIDMFIQTNSKNLPADKIPAIKEAMELLPDSKYSMISAVDFKKPGTVTALSVFFGGLGVDRFMIGDTGMGILKLLTLGGFGIVCIIDWFTIGKKTRERNYVELTKYL